jgi:hypothetical protein
LIVLDVIHPEMAFKQGDRVDRVRLVDEDDVLAVPMSFGNWQM